MGGILSDGPGDYKAYTNCEWIISSSTQIELRFISFDLEACFDSLTIKRCQSAECNVAEEIAWLSGSQVSNTTYSSGMGLCVSNQSFVDLGGATCADYDSDSSFCKWANMYPDAAGYTALDQCCACGGSQQTSSNITVSDLHIMQIIFSSDGNANGAGFEAEWQVQDMNECQRCPKGPCSRLDTSVCE